MGNKEAETNLTSFAFLKFRIRKLYKTTEIYLSLVVLEIMERRNSFLKGNALVIYYDSNFLNIFEGRIKRTYRILDYTYTIVG